MAIESPVKILTGLGLGGGLADNIRNTENSRHVPAYGGLAKELEQLLKDQVRFEMNEMDKEREREYFLNRSGSAPPSVEGSLEAIGLFSQYSAQSKFPAASNSGDSLAAEERLLSDPAYLSYYYSHVNLNPRLPPPLISRENWRLAQRLGAIREKGSLRSLNDSSSDSLFSSQPVYSTHEDDHVGLLENRNSSSGGLLRQSSSEWAEGGTDGLIGLSPIGLGARRKSFVDMIQEDFPMVRSSAYHHSRPPSRAAHDVGETANSSLEAQLKLSHSRNSSTSLNGEEMQIAMGLGSRSATPIPGSLPPVRAATVQAPRAATPLPNLQPSDLMALRRSASPALGEAFVVTEQHCVDKLASRGAANVTAGVPGLATALQNMNLSDFKEVAALEENEHLQQFRQESSEQPDQFTSFQTSPLQNMRQAQTAQAQAEAVQSSVYMQALQQLQQQLQAQAAGLQVAPSGSLAPNLYAAAAAAMSYMAGSNPYYQGSHLTGMFTPPYGLGGYPVNSSLVPSMMLRYPSTGTLPVPMDSTAMAAAVAASMEGRLAAGGVPNGAGVDMQHLYRFTGQPGTSLPIPAFDPLYLQYLQQVAQDACVMSALNHPTSVRGYMGGTYSDFLAMQKSHGGFPGVGLGTTYPSSPLMSPSIPSSPISPATPTSRQIERSPRLSSAASTRLAGVGAGMGSWQLERPGEPTEESGMSCLLEEFKNNKTRCYELSDIAGQVVEFSADQHGSRFIQQKLEVTSSEEKNMIFEEILPCALALMTDVFGNYVIQKFFEHGTSQQRRDIGNQLAGHVLSLSLQMYGCRVIQKAIEVVDVDQQTELVSELDGNVMRCVRDQNGNHVIQKCIECVPQERIQFIISAFIGQVVGLSTHPYGCRVIQRVLEHCTDENTQHCIMDEILRSACNLAQDQYGNYVVQHVLEHGKPHERTEIIKKLAGQIVQLSQHKFASNVVEKCLEFGGPFERQILINEILGDTDENEPLQAMMKDQFANYVVQKVLETCDDRQREKLVARIKVHLHALKKYTYGKHIVARVEKLVATGERRSGAHSNHK